MPKKEKIKYNTPAPACFATGNKELFGDSQFLFFDPEKKSPIHDSPIFVLNPPLEPPSKRVPNSMEFMGHVVSYPQYVRLRKIQAEVIKMDKVSETTGCPDNLLSGACRFCSVYQ